MTSLTAFEKYPVPTLERLKAALPAFNRYAYLLTRPPKNPGDQIRIQRHRAWLSCAAATFTQTFSTEVICRYWSLEIERQLNEAWRLCGLDKFPIVLAALGKLGAQELNLSSDVDLVFIKADQREVPSIAIQNFQKILTEKTDFGFCTRIDLDLRPGGRLGPILPSVSQIIDYYGNHGETWERLAFTRFRPICGPREIFFELSRFNAKFSYRRHLDYTLFDDLRLLRQRIHEPYQVVTKDRFNLKLGVGGIRDIELFIHALLIIHGGKRPNLRTPHTQRAIENLKSEGLLPPAEADFLSQTYWHYRNIENFVQIIEDQQTHTLDKAQHADLLGCLYPNDLDVVTQTVDRMVSSLMGDVPSHSQSLPSSSEEQEIWLRKLQYNDHSIREVWPQLRNATALSRSTERDELQRQIFLKNFVLSLSETSLDRDLGLSILNDFVRATRAKATFFTLLNNHPTLIQNLSWLFSASPYLGTLLTSRPELIDGFILHTQLPPNPDLDVLLQQLSDRRLLNEILSSSSFLTNRNVLLLLDSLSDVADSVCVDLIDHLRAKSPDNSLSILTLGKWGGRELGLRSDLDFIFLNSGAQTDLELKTAKRFISLMTAKNRGGSLYAVDLRLRPSGSAGPIMVNLLQLQDYLNQEAEAWERQAYLRARPLKGALPSEFFGFVRKGLSSTECDKLKDIRKQLHQTSASSLDIKFAPGGLLDIEFSAQTALLAHRLEPTGSSTLSHINTLADYDAKWKAAATEISEIYLWLRALEQAYQLLSLTPGSVINRDQESLRRLSRLYSVSEQELIELAQTKLGQCRGILNSLDPVSANI